MALKKIILSGEIGFEVLPFALREEFNQANGEDIELVFRSPGGFLSAGLEMNTIISDYKRDFPNAQMIAHVIEASSMASHILTNSAFDLRTTEQTSIGMIHNPINGIIGDYNEMRKNADFLDRLAGVMAFSYSSVMGNSLKELRSIMDVETWYVGGQALIDAGLADEMISVNSNETKEAAFAKAELRFKAVMKKVKEHETTEAEFLQAAAIVTKFEKEKPTIFNLNPDMLEKNQQSNKPAIGGKNNNQEVITVKDSNELKEKFPEIYAEVEKTAMKAGIDQEKETEKKRLETLIAMKSHDDFKNIPEALERIDKGILGFETVAQVELGLMSVLRSPAVKAIMDTNDIPDINTVDPAATASGEKGGAQDEKNKIAKNSTY